MRRDAIRVERRRIRSTISENALECPRRRIAAVRVNRNVYENRPVQSDWERRRAEMVEQQIRRRGVTDPVVLQAMREVPRERFVPEPLREEACDDRALPIGEEQTISQPFMVAYMTEHLRLQPTHRVLEVGTGSGYQTAVLARIAAEVHTIERIPVLKERAERLLRELGVGNVRFHLGDGSRGLPHEAPFDRILVTAAAPRVPPPLIDQLAENGILVLPVGGKKTQTVTQVVKTPEGVRQVPLLSCRFVRLIGDDAWPEGEDASSPD